MSKPGVSHWIGKSADDVLAEAFHEMRDPIYIVEGFLRVLKSVELSSEEAQQYIDLVLNRVLYTKEIIDSVYQYMNEKRKGQ